MFYLFQFYHFCAGHANRFIKVTNHNIKQSVNAVQKYNSMVWEIVCCIIMSIFLDWQILDVLKQASIDIQIIILLKQTIAQFFDLL